MKIIVLGGTGNISTQIVSRLLAEGHEVTCFNRGRHKIRYSGDVTVINGDRQNRAAFESAMKPLSFDAVIDMIAFTPEDAASTLKAFEGRVGQFVFTSSVAAYHRPFKNILVPDDTALLTENTFPYGYKKAEMERFLYQKMDEGINITVIRPSLTFGIGCANIGVMRNNYGILERIRGGKPIIVFGDGTNPWTWTFAPDLAKAYAGVLGNAKAIGQCYHACSEDAHIWDELYLTFGRIIGVEPKLIHISTEMLCAVSPETFDHVRLEKMYCGLYDNTKIKSHVPGFQIEYTLEKMLRAINDWYEKDPEARVIDEAKETLEDEIVARYNRFVGA